VQRVLIDENNHQIELIVADDQLSLAIGRRGQNVKLATKLLGWNIEIHGESRIAEVKVRLKEDLVKLDGLDESTIEYLFKLGYHSPENLLNADETELAAIPGISILLAQGIQQVAYELKQKLKVEQAAAQVQAQAAQAAPAMPAPEVPVAAESIEAPEVATEAEAAEAPAEPAASEGGETAAPAVDGDATPVPEDKA
ncbi:MAG TPA: helix-hairpin-helix domain-containing protein, partial [Myxococcota bacterium]|nr:helix-hairpin-helix domain-containing protein [Myxococcota bacterium]